MQTISISDLSNTQAKLIARATQEALKAQGMCFKHGSVAAENSKVVATGHNHSRNKLRGRVLCSFHAEVDVLSRLLRGTLQPNRKTNARFEEACCRQPTDQPKGAVEDADKPTNRFTQVAKAA